MLEFNSFTPIQLHIKIKIFQANAISLFTHKVQRTVRDDVIAVSLYFDTSLDGQ